MPAHLQIHSKCFEAKLDVYWTLVSFKKATHLGAKELIEHLISSMLMSRTPKRRDLRACIVSWLTNAHLLPYLAWFRTQLLSKEFWQVKVLFGHPTLTMAWEGENPNAQFGEESSPTALLIGTADGT